MDKIVFSWLNVYTRILARVCWINFNLKFRWFRLPDSVCIMETSKSLPPLGTKILVDNQLPWVESRNTSTLYVWSSDYLVSHGILVIRDSDCHKPFLFTLWIPHASLNTCNSWYQCSSFEYLFNIIFKKATKYIFLLFI